MLRHPNKEGQNQKSKPPLGVTMMPLGECLPGALPFYWLSRLQPEIYPPMEKAPQIDHDGPRTFPTKHVA